MTDVILLFTCVVGLVLASFAAFPPPGFMIAFAAFLRSAPSFLDTVWQISTDLLALFAIIVLVAGVIRRRLDVIRDVCISLATAIVIWLLVARWVQGEWPAVWDSLRLDRNYSWYPSLRIALPVAVIVTAAPHLTRPFRRVGRWLIAFACIGLTALSVTSLLGALAGVLVGAAAGSVVHLIFGSSAGRPSLDDVARALAHVGVPTRSLSPARRQPAGLFEVLGEDSDGNPLVIKVYGRDAHDSALVTTMWHTLWYRDPGSPLRFGRLQQVEHEALVTLLAAQSGVLTEEVVTAGATTDDDAILVMRGRGTPLDELDSLDHIDRAAIVDQLWEMLAGLHSGSINHGSIDCTTIIVDDGRTGLVDFGGGGVAVNDAQINADRVQAFVTSVLLTNEADAVASAQRALGDDGVQAMLPHLQSATLTARQRRDVRAAEIELDEMRERISEVIGVEEPELVKLRRVTIGSLLKVLLPGFAIIAITSALSGLDFEAVGKEVAAATVWLLVLGFLVAQVTRVTQAVSTLGASPKRLPFGPVYALQLAVGYLNIAIPSYAARVAVIVRFFQRLAIPPGAALAAGALDVMTTFFIEVIGISCMLLFTPASLDLDLSGTGSAVIRLLIIVGVLVGLIVLAVVLVRKLREYIVEQAKRLGTEAMAVLRGLHSPRRLALLLGGNIATEILFTLALGIFARSMGYTISFADLLLIHLSVALLAGLVPVPGGIGISEAMLTVGLIRAGMPDETAFAAAICYRAATFYLPPIWGFFSLRWLERAKYV